MFPPTWLPTFAMVFNGSIYSFYGNFEIRKLIMLRKVLILVSNRFLPQAADIIDQHKTKWKW